MATFGYTTQGDSNAAFAVNGANATRFTAPSDVGVVSKLSAYFLDPDSDGNVKGCIWLQSDLSLVAVSDVVSTIGGGLKDMVFSSPPTLTPNVDYYLGTVSQTGGGLRSRMYYITAGANIGIDNQANNYTTPTNLSADGTTTKQYSIYATYTPSGVTYWFSALI